MSSHLVPIAESLSPSNDVARVSVSWREVEAALLRIAGARGALDAEEGGWLLAAERTQVHRHRGCVTLLEYFERVLGYTPRIARDRLRVAEALQDLPAMREALAAGRLAYSCVRELTRVAVPDTEAAWLAAAAGKTVRQIEGMVAGRRPGDTPDSEADLSLIKRVLRFEVSDQTYALLREAQRRIAGDLGNLVDDDQLVAELARAVLGGGSAEGRDHGRSPHQIMITTCDRCQRATQDAAGEVVAIDLPVVERAECDAQEIRATHVGQRATQTVAPARRREIFRRDHGRCVVPGCRSTRHLEVHHLIPRENQGTDDASNLCLLCGGHHDAHHRGFIHLEGTADAVKFSGLAGPPDPRRDDARSALRNLKIKDGDACWAVDTASAKIGREGTLVELIKAALAELRNTIWKNSWEVR